MLFFFAEQQRAEWECSHIILTPPRFVENLQENTDYRDFKILIKNYPRQTRSVIFEHSLERKN